MKHLYLWCKGDEQLMDEYLRASGRYGMRPQQTHNWNEYKWSQTYDEMIIWKAYRGHTFEAEYL